MFNAYVVEINGTAIQVFLDMAKAEQFRECMLDEDYFEEDRYMPGEITIATLPLTK